MNLVRQVNKLKRRFLQDYKTFKTWEDIYKQEKLVLEQEKREKKIQNMKNGHIQGLSLRSGTPAFNILSHSSIF